MLTVTSLGPLLAADPVKPTAGSGQLLAAALIGIAAIVLLITWGKLHPFISLMIGALLVGLIGNLPLAVTLKTFSDGVGKTLAGVGILIALGAVIGKLLADSGGADAIVDTIVGKAPRAALPWAMGLVGALIGLPMFFEIGLVLLIPVIILVAKRAEMPLMKIGIPALAGLSAMHGFVPPHPGPLAAIDSVKADLGTVLGVGILVAIPTIILAGPLFGQLAGRWVPHAAPDTYSVGESGAAGIAPRRPGFAITLFTVLLPVVLMMGKSVADIYLAKGDATRHLLDFIGEPLMALLITTLVAMFTLGLGSGMKWKQVGDTVGGSLPGIAGILLIVGAGGGFKEELVNTGIGTMLANFVIRQGGGASQVFVALSLAWLVAVAIRLATGSATVATVTTAGLLAPVAATLPANGVALMVLAIGAGSVFFSHVNDAGFWLVKEYFGVSVKENILTWSLMETVISVAGLVVVLLAALVMV